MLNVKSGQYFRQIDSPIYQKGRAENFPNYIEYWFKDDKIHRDDDLPAVIQPNDGKSWFKDGAFLENLAHR